MYRRDRVGSGSNVSSVVSSFTKKSREAAAVKEHVPSRVSREASFNSRDTYGQSRVSREPSFNSKESLNSRSNRDTNLTRKESTSSAKSRDSSIPVSVVTRPQKESTSSHNGDHQDGSQSIISQSVSRQESTASSVSSVDSESTTSSQATVNTSISTPKVVFLLDFALFLKIERYMMVSMIRISFNP